MASKMTMFGVCVICGATGCNCHGPYIDCDECLYIDCILVDKADRVMLQHIVCAICEDDGGFDEEYSD